MLDSVLITGCTGFLGRALLNDLRQAGLRSIVAAVRSGSVSCGVGVRAATVGEINESTDWTDAVKGIDLVIHCAGRVPVSADFDRRCLDEFYRVNVAGSLRLARQAASAGARRFVFISSIKVNGERTSLDGVFTESDPPCPEDTYGRSKAEAEAVLRRVGAETGMEVTIIRLPLVYGPGVKGSFHQLMGLASSGIPFPFGSIQNRRSFLYLGNLISFVRCALHHPNAANETFLISDGEDLSTAELIRRLSAAMGRRPWLVPVPAAALRIAGRVTGRTAQVERLCGSLRVDISKARRLLGWTPPFTVDQGIAATVQHWPHGRQKR